MLSEAECLKRENRPFATLRMTTIPHSEFRISGPSLRDLTPYI